MAVHSTPTNNRKNPPTFRHLPRNRAQKLKKSWIEKKKLQSRWRAQKRKEGLGIRPSGNGDFDEPTDCESNPEPPEHHLEGPGTQKRKIPGDDGTGTETGASSSSSVADIRDRDDLIIDEESISERPPLQRKKARMTVPQVDEVERPSQNRSAKSKGKQPARPLAKAETRLKEPGDDDGQPSLRELSRRAYAPSSLHAYKADPLHRRKDAVTPHRHNEARPSKGNESRSASLRSSSQDDRRRGETKGRSLVPGPGRGGHHHPRGQPNMRLRMEAMLERIKRNCS